tara:strand:- start:415 stop:720 length:306 start_codon:yes stop_codon:yes gene_type:complete
LKINITLSYIYVDINITLSYIIRMKIEKKALKALKKMDAKTRAKFFAAFDLIDDGNFDGLDITKLEGRDGSRLRIGKYRALFTQDFELIVINVGPRGDIYK